MGTLSTPFWEFPSHAMSHPVGILRPSFLLPFGSFSFSPSSIAGLEPSIRSLSTPFWEFPAGPGKYSVIFMYFFLLPFGSFDYGYTFQTLGKECVFLSTPFWEFHENDSRRTYKTRHYSKPFYSLLGVSEPVQKDIEKRTKR